MAQAPTLPTPAKPSEPIKPTGSRGRKPNRIQASHSGSVSTFVFADKSGTLTQDVLQFPVAVRLWLMRTGLSRIVSATSTLKGAQTRVAALMEGKWSGKQPRPTLPNVLAQALANMAKAQGKGLHTDTAFAEICSASFWQVRLYGKDGKSGMSKTQRNELRAKDDIQIAIRAVKLERARAATATLVAAGKAVPVQQDIIAALLR